MKNKFLIPIIALLIAVCSTVAYGQGTPYVQSNGASPYFSKTLKTVTPQGTDASSARDTLTNADTGTLYIWVGQGFDMSFEMTRRVLTGTVASESDILYGYNNNGNPLTAAQAATVTGTAITGTIASCAGCIAASYTVVPTGTVTKYWQVPRSAGALFDNYFIKTIQTGTVTSTYSGKILTER